MDQLEYQQECGLTRFPFRDNATLLWTNTSTSGTFSNEIVKDAQLIIFDGTTANIRLSTIVYDSSTWQFNFVGAASISIVVTNDSGINTYKNRSNDNNKLLKIDIDCDALSSYFLSLAADTYTFDSSCLLCLSCIKLLPPNITRLRLDNTLNNNSVSNIYDSGVILPVDGLNLVEGANTTFTINDIVDVDIGRGLGAGQYDGCPGPSNNLLTVNNVAPDNRGNLLLNNDMCYSTYPGLQGLHLKNVCKPRCTSPEIINLANYYNRITDLTNQLHTYMLTSNTNYESWLDKYEELEAAKLAPKNPYIIAHANTISNKANQFHNITLGIYSPGKTNIDTTVTLACSTSEFTAMPGTAYITMDNVKKVIPNPIFSSGKATLLHKSLSCNNNVYAGLVLSESIPVTSAGVTTHSNFGNSLYDVTSVLTCASTGQSGYVVPLNPQSFNFTIAYSVYFVVVNSVMQKQVIKIDLGFIDPTLPTGNVTCEVDTDTTCTITSNKLVLAGIAQNVVGKGFSNKSMNFKEENHHYITLEVAPSRSGDFVVSFKANGPTGLANKTLTITL